MGDDRTATADRWRARPVAAGAVRVLTVVVPLLAGFVLARAAAGVLSGVPGGRALTVLCGVAVALAGRRAVRPVVAFATLLDLGLVFPGPAPRRPWMQAHRLRPRAAVRQARQSREGTPAQSAEALAVLLAVLGAHDRRHRHHTRRVLAVTALLADRLGVSGPEADRLTWAALLHDVGLLVVDRQVLARTGRPTPAQWATLRRHVEDGAEMVGPLLGWLGPEGDAIRLHHERWDGTGYPEGLAGEAIPRAARIVGLADAYESMTAARAYRAPLATRAARAEVVRCSGTQFDPEVVDALLAVPVPTLLRATGLVALLANLPWLGTLARIGQRGVVAAAVPQATAIATSTAVVLGGMAATGGFAGAVDGGKAGTWAASGEPGTPSPTSSDGPSGPPSGSPSGGPSDEASGGATTGASGGATGTGVPQSRTSTEGGPAGTSTTGHHVPTTGPGRTTTSAPSSTSTTTSHPPTTTTTSRPPTTTRPPTSTTTTRPPTTPPPTSTSSGTGPPSGPGTGTGSGTTTTRTTTTTAPRPTTTTRTPGPTMTSSTGTPHPTSGSPSPAPDAAPAWPAGTSGEPMTMLLPAMRAPSEGPVAPRIAIAPPGATDLPAAGFIWNGVSGLGYESRLDDGPWLPATDGWFAIFIDLDAGPHHFYVRSVDPHDGSRSAAARYDWVVAG